MKFLGYIKNIQHLPRLSYLFSKEHLLLGDVVLGLRECCTCSFLRLWIAQEVAVWKITGGHKPCYEYVTLSASLYHCRNGCSYAGRMLLESYVGVVGGSSWAFSTFLCLSRNHRNALYS